MSWEEHYDKWKTTLPEPKESRFKCDRCGMEFYPEESYYDIDGDKLCNRCANNWFNEQIRYATEEECYGI